MYELYLGLVYTLNSSVFCGGPLSLESTRSALGNFTIPRESTQKTRRWSWDLWKQEEKNSTSPNKTHWWSKEKIPIKRRKCVNVYQLLWSHHSRSAKKRITLFHLPQLICRSALDIIDIQFLLYLHQVFRERTRLSLSFFPIIFIFLLYQRIQIIAAVGEAGRAHQHDYDCAEPASLFAGVTCAQSGLSYLGV